MKVRGIGIAEDQGFFPMQGGMEASCAPHHQHGDGTGPHLNQQWESGLGVFNDKIPINHKAKNIQWRREQEMMRIGSHLLIPLVKPFLQSPAQQK